MLTKLQVNLKKHKLMKRILNYIFIVTLGLSMSNCSPKDGDIGPEGTKGEQGDAGNDGVDGKDGNANVQKFSFYINSADWGSGHFGAGNVHHTYKVESSLTGDISMSNSDYAVIGYASVDQEGGDSYSEYKPMPYTYGTRDNYGVKIEMDLGRNYILLSKTLNGYDNKSFGPNEMPKRVRVQLVFIKIGVLSKIQEEVGINNYKDVMHYLDSNNSY